MKKNILILLLLISIPTFIYFNSFSNDFVSLDDNQQVYENNLVQNLNVENIKTLFTSSITSMYQPLTSVFFSSIVSFFGVKSATPYHIFSFLIHLINLLLVYFIGLKILKNNYKAILLSILFSASPFSGRVCCLGIGYKYITFLSFLFSRLTFLYKIYRNSS